ncbi:MAG TPA: hypothetical protein VG537_11540 [Candidatus Kapabacteria bacterium]|jgi:hypothetical protein|nr:hypothetical protein [Candidatus Kapabacteria bacterium]
MSRAFVKEPEGEWLGDVAPDIAALERYLTRENGEKIFELRTTKNAKTGRETHEMTNGNCYTLDMDGRWSVVR